MNAQNQIRAQGRSQMQAALAASGGNKTSSVASTVPAIISITAAPTKPTTSE